MLFESCPGAAASLQAARRFSLGARRDVEIPCLDVGAAFRFLFGAAGTQSDTNALQPRYLTVAGSPRAGQRFGEMVDGVNATE